MAEIIFNCVYQEYILQLFKCSFKIQVRSQSLSITINLLKDEAKLLSSMLTLAKGFRMFSGGSKEKFGKERKNKTIKISLTLWRWFLNDIYDIFRNFEQFSLSCLYCSNETPFPIKDTLNSLQPGVACLQPLKISENLQFSEVSGGIDKQRRDVIGSPFWRCSDKSLLLKMT